MTRRGGIAGLWTQALAVGFAIASAPALTALCVVLLLPGLVAWCVDTAHGRPMGRAILSFGIAGAFAPIWHHIQHGQTVPGAVDTIIHSPAIGIAWGLAGAGWLIGRVAQLAIELHIRSRVAEQVRQLRARRQALEMEWDLSRH